MRAVSARPCHVRSVFHSLAALAVLCGLIVGTSGCGKKTIAWPTGAGYVKPAASRPDKPHTTTSETKATITGAEGDQLAIAPGSQCQMPVNGPGAQWVVLCGKGKSITVKDYNKDECVLPHGITVRVDTYGQFVPTGYDANRK